MSKRKILSLVIALLVAATMICSCNSYQDNSATTTKTPTQNVIDEIAGLSAYSSLEEVKRVRELYDELSSTQEKAITNYDHLLYCEECANYIDTVNKAFEFAEKDLKSTLRNPQSLQIHEKTYRAYCIYDSKDEITDIWIEIDYSAQNGFGGYDRDTYAEMIEIEYSYDKSIESMSIDQYGDYRWREEDGQRYNPPY